MAYEMTTETISLRLQAGKALLAATHSLARVLPAQTVAILASLAETGLTTGNYLAGSAACMALRDSLDDKRVVNLSAQSEQFWAAERLRQMFGNMHYVNNMVSISGNSAQEQANLPRILGTRLETVIEDAAEVMAVTQEWEQAAAVD